MWIVWLCAEAWAGWVSRPVSNTDPSRLPLNHVLTNQSAFTWHAVEEADPTAVPLDGANLNYDPQVVVREWFHPPGSAGGWHSTYVVAAGLLNNDTDDTEQLAFHLPAMCYLDLYWYLDLRSSIDAQDPATPPRLTTRVWFNFPPNGTAPTQSIEAAITTTELGGHHTLGCRPEDGGWLERLWTEKPPPVATSNDVKGKVAVDGSVPDWSGSTGETTFAASSTLIEDHGVEAFFAAGGVAKRVVVWHLKASNGNDALQVRIDAWDAVSDVWNLSAGPYSLIGAGGAAAYNWPAVAIWQDPLGIDYIRVVAEDIGGGDLVTWSCSGSDLAAACGSNTSWSPVAVVAPLDPPPFGRTDQDPILAVSASGHWLLAAQRVAAPEYKDGDEVLFLSACGNAAWATEWDKRFWPDGGGTSSTAIGVEVPPGGMARLAYRRLKGWPQIVADEYYDRVSIGYVVEKLSSVVEKDYEAWTAEGSFTEICEEAG